MRIEEIQGFNPLPTDLHGWNGKSDIFAKLIEEVRPKRIVEIGSWKGQSTITMAKACQKLGLKTEIQCIDTWLGAEEFYTQPTKERDLMKKWGYPNVYYQFLSNIINEGVVEMIEPITVPSSIGVYLASNAEMVYIDGSHSYTDVLEDIKNMWPKTKLGGVMFGDDYTNKAFPGVKRAVDEFAKLFELEVEIYDNWFWVIRKK